MSEPTSSARIYVESSSTEDTSEQHSFDYFNARGDGKDSEALLENFSRPLRERYLVIFPLFGFDGQIS